MTTELWSGGLYAANTAHHRAFDAAILKDLPLEPDAAVLDLGCGVGDFTARLAAWLPAGRVLGVDAAPDQIATARDRHDAPNLRFAHAAAQDLSEVARPGEFDAVVSIAVLHWIPAADHPAVLAGVRRVLRDGGLFRAEFGGAGQVAATRVILDEESAALGGPASPWYFPTPEPYADAVAAAGLSVRRIGLVRQRRAIPDAAALTGWLRSQVLLAYLPELPADAREEFRRRAETRAIAELRRADGSYDQDYVRLDLLASA
jgi:trans-aconitate 2-methyltransferase